jgi:hypothetical protein
MVKTNGIVECISEGVIYAFLDQMFSRFGAPIKILIDEGTKFCGEFQELCEKALVDHCTISQYHPKVDVLTEWIVQMMK